MAQDTERAFAVCCGKAFSKVLAHRCFTSCFSLQRTDYMFFPPDTCRALRSVELALDSPFLLQDWTQLEGEQ